MGSDPRDQLSDLLESGWKVVGYNNRAQMLESDEREWYVHSVLVQKENSLRCYEIIYDADRFDVFKEVIIAPGKYK